jgi:hypothetical protein
MYLIQCCGGNNSCLNLHPKKKPLTWTNNQPNKVNNEKYIALFKGSEND